MSMTMSNNAESRGEIVQFEALEEQRIVLERRLHEGYLRIEEALEAGQDVTGWERFWIELLHQYEAVCAQLKTAA